MKYPFFFSVLFPFLIPQISVGQVQKAERSKFITFEKGHTLGSYYPLDSIKIVILHNRTGSHILSKIKISILATALKKYVFGGNYAHAKPGHIDCQMTFKNGTTLSFYSNGGSDVIIWFANDTYRTFISNDKISFDKF